MVDVYCKKHHVSLNKQMEVEFLEAVCTYKTRFVYILSSHSLSLYIIVFLTQSLPL